MFCSTIELDELRIALKKLSGLEADDAELEMMMTEVHHGVLRVNGAIKRARLPTHYPMVQADGDGNGVVDFAEFATMMGANMDLVQRVTSDASPVHTYERDTGCVRLPRRSRGPRTCSA